MGTNFQLLSLISSVIGGKNFVYSTLDEVLNFIVVFLYE